MDTTEVCLVIAHMIRSILPHQGQFPGDARLHPRRNRPTSFFVEKIIANESASPQGIGRSPAVSLPPLTVDLARKVPLSRELSHYKLLGWCAKWFIGVNALGYLPRYHL